MLSAVLVALNGCGAWAARRDADSVVLAIWTSDGGDQHIRAWCCVGGAGLRSVRPISVRPRNEGDQLCVASVTEGNGRGAAARLSAPERALIGGRLEILFLDSSRRLDDGRVLMGG